MKNPQIQQEARPSVTQEQVEKLMALRESQVSLLERLRLIKKSIESEESQIIELIESGADLSKAGYAVSVDIKERRYPSWKLEIVSRLGKDVADEILAATPPTISKRLVVK